MKKIIISAISITILIVMGYIFFAEKLLFSCPTIENPEGVEKPHRAETNLEAAIQGSLWKAVKFRKFNGQKRKKEVREIPKSTINCENWVVITSIFNPTKLCEQITELKEWCLVVVGDEKSDNEVWKKFAQEKKNFYYLSSQQQRELPFKMTQHLPWNNFGRKNVGYMFAISNGAKYIYDTDVDNELKNVEVLGELKEIFKSKEISLIDSANGFNHWNPHPCFSPRIEGTVNYEEISWPRGYPLNTIKYQDTQSCDGKKNNRRKGFIVDSKFGRS